MLIAFSQYRGRRVPASAQEEKPRPISSVGDASRVGSASLSSITNQEETPHYPIGFTAQIVAEPTRDASPTELSGAFSCRREDASPTELSGDLSCRREDASPPVLAENRMHYLSLLRPGNTKNTGTNHLNIKKTGDVDIFFRTFAGGK